MGKGERERRREVNKYKRAQGAPEPVNFVCVCVYVLTAHNISLCTSI